VLRRIARVAAISFARGIPGPDLLPVDAFGACAQAAVARDGARALNYGPPSGYPPLRDWVAERHGVAPGRVVLTTGSLQGFNFLARSFVGRGAKIFVEAPCYDRSLGILRALGAHAEEVPLRADGLDLDALAARLEATPGEKVVYTIPTFQNPSGRTLSRANRTRLLDLARAAGAVVVEDDPYGLLRFQGEPLPTLFELAGGDGVVFISSFSKTVAPGIRVGYLVLPEELVPPIEAFVLENYVSPSIFVQAALYEFVTGDGFERSLSAIRAALRLRRDAMLEALSAEFPSGSAWNEPDGGYFLWVDLPPGVDSSELLARASQAEVTFVQGSDFYLVGGGEGAARLAFSFASAGEIREGIARLGGLVREAAAVAA
jgi:2-aminoadipate transaminase